LKGKFSQRATPKVGANSIWFVDSFS